MADFIRLALPGVQKLSPYVPGKPVEELARELNLDPANIVKLASNENPLGPSPKAVAAIQAAVTDISRYPDGSGFALKAKLCERFNLAMGQITLGNGSNDLLELVARAWLAPGRNAVFSQYAFAVYPLATLAVGAELRQVPALNYGHDLDAMLAAIDENTRVVFVANPNNPTGTWFDAKALDSFLARVPEDVIVVLDEAYFEFAQGQDLPNGLEYVSRYPNLIVSRTLCKAYGLAGLRVGYAVSSEQIADVLNRVRQPFNVNSLALVAAIAALDDSDYLEQGRVLNAQGMAQLEQGFEALGLNWIRSRGNFIAVDFGQDAAPIDRALLEQGVIVRPLAGYGMGNFLRISIGTQAENARLLEALAKAIGRG